MKTTPVQLIVIFICSILINGCCWMHESFCPEPKITAEGQVLDYQQQPIQQASIVISYKKSEEVDEIFQVTGISDAEGFFKLEVPRVKKYVVNISKANYGFNSFIIEKNEKLDSIPYNIYYLNQATVQTIDASIGGTITVSNIESLGSASSNADWSKSVTGKLPLVLDDSGRVASFNMPQSLKTAWDIQSNNKARLSRTSLRIRANSLVNSNGSPAVGNVSVSVSAIDVFAPGGMPGNNIASTNQSASGYMQSFGAVAVSIYDEDQSYNLNPKNKASAEIIMPIPDWQRELKIDFPRVVPIVHYNEETGIWEESGEASLVDSLFAYVGEVKHFSAINFDIIKTDPSANIAFEFGVKTVVTTPANPNYLRFPFKVELTTDVVGDQTYVRTRTINHANILCPNVPGPSATDLYTISLNRLPVNTPVAVVFFNEEDSPTSGDPLVNALYVVETNDGHQDITDNPTTVPNCTDLETDVYSTKISISPDTFIDGGSPVDILAAMCTTYDESTGDPLNYYLSVASRDLSFDPKSLNIRLSPGFMQTCDNYPGSPTLNDQYYCLDNSSGCTGSCDFCFTQISQTTLPSVENPEWVVGVFEIPVSDVCGNEPNEFIIGFYTSPVGSSYLEYDISPATCTSPMTAP